MKYLLELLTKKLPLPLFRLFVIGMFLVLYNQGKEVKLQQETFKIQTDSKLISLWKKVSEIDRSLFGVLEWRSIINETTKDREIRLRELEKQRRKYE